MKRPTKREGFGPRRSVRMLAAALVCTLALLPLAGCRADDARTTGRPAMSSPDLAAVPAPDVIRGMTLKSEDHAAYPPAEKLSREELSAAADAIVTFAAENSLNSIFYEANPLGEAMYPSDVLPLSRSFAFSAGFFQKLDPLAILIERAAEKGIAVYAVLSPYEAGTASDKPKGSTLQKKEPDSTITVGSLRYFLPDRPAVHAQAVAAAVELAGRYNLAGVVLGQVDDSEVSDYTAFYTYLSALCLDVSTSVKAAATGAGRAAQFGVFLSSAAQPSGNRTAFLSTLRGGGADFALPAVHEGPGGGTASPYAKGLSAFQQSLGALPVYPVLSSDGLQKPEDYGQALFIGNMAGVLGGVAGDYSALKSDTSGILDTVIPLFFIEKPIMPETTLEIPTEFRLTRPLDGAKLNIDPTWEKYYITGTSDPSKPVFYNNEEITRLGDRGTFGMLVDVPQGENTYSFMQDGVTLTATINRPKPGAAAKISKISTYVSSAASAVLQPYSDQVVGQGLPMLFQCTAPSGGKVSATLNGVTYELQQTKNAEDGTPATFRKEIPIVPEDADAVVSAGKVTFTLVYQGETSTAEAPGEVFFVGKNRVPLYQVQAGLGTVLTEALDPEFMMTTLKPGSVGEIVGQTANYFKTSFGGFIQKAEVSIPTDLQSAENDLSAAEYQSADVKGDERLILRGTVAPSFVVDDAAGGNFTIRLFDSRGLPNGAVAAESAFFSGVDAKTDGDGTLTLTFKAGDEPYFGYHVSYDGGDTILSFYKRPTISGVRGRPLLGLKIVVDPGHGARDVGAMGLAGVTGPMEKNVNLYAGHITARLLEGLGAEVYLTRETDEDFLELDERVLFTEEREADLFLSVHHNSLNENINAEKIHGMYVFYYNDISAGLAETLLQGVTKQNGRDAIRAEKARYVVCRTTMAPSLLLELGFMPNAMEYENVCDTDQMMTTARAICEGVVEYLQ